MLKVSFNTILTLANIEHVMNDISKGLHNTIPPLLDECPNRSRRTVQRTGNSFEFIELNRLRWLQNFDKISDALISETPMCI